MWAKSKTNWYRLNILILNIFLKMFVYRTVFQSYYSQTTCIQPLWTIFNPQGHTITWNSGLSQLVWITLLQQLGLNWKETWIKMWGDLVKISEQHKFEMVDAFKLGQIPFKYFAFLKLVSISMLLWFLLLLHYGSVLFKF